MSSSLFSILSITSFVTLGLFISIIIYRLITSNRNIQSSDVVFLFFLATVLTHLGFEYSQKSFFGHSYFFYEVYPYFRLVDAAVFIILMLYLKIRTH
jgi:hypothetical protein